MKPLPNPPKSGTTADVRNQMLMRAHDAEIEERCSSAVEKAMTRFHKKRAEIAEQQIVSIRSTILLVLDCADYTQGNCRANEMVGAVLPKEIIAKMRAVVEK